MKPQASFGDHKTALIVPLWILAAIATGYILQEASVIALWIISSFFLFALIDPFMQKLNKKGVAPIVSALLLVGLVTALLAGIGFVIYQSAPAIAAEFDTYRKTVMDLYHRSTQSLGSWVHNISSMNSSQGASQAAAAPKVQQVELVDKSPLSGAFANTMLHGLGSALTVATFAILTPILTLFLVAERNNFGAVTKRLYPEPGQGAEVWKKITDATGAFFLGNFVIAGVCFPVFLVAFLLFKVNSPVVMAAIAAIFNLVPFLGALLSGIVPVMGIVAHGGSPGSAAGLFGICVLMHFTVANLVTPKILGSKLDINATVSTIVLIAFGELLGGMGLLLAIPMAAVIKILCQSSSSSYLQWVAAFMSEDGGSLLRQGLRRSRAQALYQAQEEAAAPSLAALQLARDEAALADLPLNEYDAELDEKEPRQRRMN